MRVLALGPAARGLGKLARAPRVVSGMGAFAWKCVAPFGEDAGAVLVAAQKRAFRERAYGKPYARGLPAAKSIRALVAACAEEGTCSILDVTRIGDAPGPGVAGPFSHAILTSALGTVRPTLEQIQDGALALYEELGRGEAAYVVAFEDGEPTNVVFLGYSFD